MFACKFVCAEPFRCLSRPELELQTSARVLSGHANCFLGEQGPMYSTPLMGFIDEQCVIFDTEEENKLEYTTTHLKRCRHTIARIGQTRSRHSHVVILENEVARHSEIATATFRDQQVHQNFKKLVDTLITDYLLELGIPEQKFSEGRLAISASFGLCPSECGLNLYGIGNVHRLYPRLSKTIVCSINPCAIVFVWYQCDSLPTHLVKLELGSNLAPIH
eukprot:1183924-Prorocentrum_minimum.AAC.3